MSKGKGDGKGQARETRATTYVHYTACPLSEQRVENGEAVAEVEVDYIGRAGNSGEVTVGFTRDMVEKNDQPAYLLR